MLVKQSLGIAMNRSDMGSLISSVLDLQYKELKQAWESSGNVKYFYIDNLLPIEVVAAIRNAYPSADQMKFKDTLRERKLIAAQMDQYDPVLEEILYAFQQQSVVESIAAITGIKALEPDAQLYAGGISRMEQGHFLNPHIDNSHDKERKRYRVLNLLFYVSPDWSLENGGNLELWPEGVRGKPVTITSAFNRLVVMITDTRSWHSVSPLVADASRCCVSNYYFSKVSPEGKDYFHVTSFRGRPEQKLRTVALMADQALRMGIRRFFPQGLLRTGHYYKK